MWNILSENSESTFQGLLAAHKLLLALTDVCSESVNVLTQLDVKTLPMLVSYQQFANDFRRPTMSFIRAERFVAYGTLHRLMTVTPTDTVVRLDCS